MFFKNPKCPVCREGIKDLIFDFDSSRIICARCKSELEPNLVINNSTVNYLANLIPSDVREDFPFNLGFEKKPIPRTPKLALWFLILMMILGTVAGILINIPNLLKVIGAALVGGLLIWRIFEFYKEEEIPKWQKRGTT